MLPTQFVFVQTKPALRYYRSEAMTGLSHPRSKERQASSDDQKEAWLNIGGSTRTEMHELGNLIVALQFCLRQLGGRQSTHELEGLVRTGLEVCEQGIAAFRKVHEAVRVHH